MHPCLPIVLAFSLGTSAVPQKAPTRKQTVLAERVSKDKEFSHSRTSPMAGVDRKTFPTGTTVWLGAYRTGYSSGEHPPEGTRYSLAAKEHTWTWESLDGREKGALTSSKEFHLGEHTVMAYPNPAEITLICFDARRAEHKAFHGLWYFAYDEQYAVPAKLHVYPQPATVVMATSRQTEKTFYRYAECLFIIGGTPCRLGVFKSELTGPNAETLFIPFTDITTGKQSYPAGRFLEIPDPHAADFILDFNEAFNPLCNYADAYNCPKPPKENALSVAVNAGEMTYGKH